MDQVDQDDRAVTLIQANPVRTSRTRFVVVMTGVLVFDVLVGCLFLWWVGALLAAVTLFQLPFLVRFVARRTAHASDRLEVRTDRITLLVTSRGDADELVRADGGLLEVRELATGRHVFLVGPGGDNGSLSLDRFDLDEVGRAALAHGWLWRPSDASAPIQPPESTAVEANEQHRMPTEIALREGRARTVPSKATLRFLGIVVGSVVLPVLVTAVVLWDPAPWVMGLLIALVVLTPAALIVGGSFVLVRLSRCTVTVDAEQVSVKYGSLSAQVLRREAIVSGRVGGRWARLRNHHGKQLMWVPLRPKRDEVLTALRAHGWPVTEGGPS